MYGWGKVTNFIVLFTWGKMMMMICSIVCGWFMRISILLLLYSIFTHTMMIILRLFANVGTEGADNMYNLYICCLSHAHSQNGHFR